MAWVESQSLLDRVLEPFDALLVRTVVADAASRVLDVGCGTGSTTLALTRGMGTAGTCTGIDVSEPMIAAARARVAEESPRPELILGDAETHAFAPASFDAIVSRFGVMFFRDSVAAFANLRRAAKPGARLACIVWRSTQENEFMVTAERVAAPLLPNLPPRRPDEPGQFAFADRERVAGILRKSGWSGIDIQAIDVPCCMPESALTGYLTTMGPVGRALDGADARTRAEVSSVVRPAFEPYVHGTEVRFVCACWMLGARA